MPTIETRPYNLENAEIPASFSSRRRAQETVDGVYLEGLTIPELEIEKLEGIRTILTHPQTNELICQGKLTFAMIKPHANEGEGLSNDDDAAAQEVLAEIGENAVFALPIKFRKEDAGKFYQNLEERPAVHQEVVEFTTSDSLTAVLIYKKDANELADLGEGHIFDDGSTILPNGLLTIDGDTVQLDEDTVVFRQAGKPVVKHLSQLTEEEGEELKDRRMYFMVNGHLKVRNESAVVWWRDKMGDTMPNKARENNPNSIRARHATGVPNNIVHGSDSPESVRREIRILAEAVGSLLEQNKANQQV